MIVPMHRARRVAAARMHHPRRDALSVLPGVCPISVAAEIPDGRPIRHRGRRRVVVERLEISGPKDDAAANDSQLAGNVGNLGLGAAKEIPIGHNKIGELTNLDSAFLAFFI
jgi:hypothetical protein